MDELVSHSATEELEDRPLVAEDDGLDAPQKKQKNKRNKKSARSKSKEKTADDDEGRRMLMESERENSESPSFVEGEVLKTKNAGNPPKSGNDEEKEERGEINRAFEGETTPRGNGEISAIPTHEPDPNVAAERKELKNKKRKKKKKDPPATASPPQRPPPPSAQAPIDDDGRVFGVVVHRAEQLQMDDQLIFHPVVVVSVVDAVTGEPVVKSATDRAVSSFYETQNENVTTILPLMTAPFDFREHRSVIPGWEEMVIFNEPIGRFFNPPSVIKDSSSIEDSSSSFVNVVVVFEILDFITRSPAGGRGIPFSQQQQQQKASASGSRWQRVAWAFLKVVGPNGESNAGCQARLQLWYPPRGSANPRQINADKSDIWTAWKRGKCRKYPATMWVTLKSVALPEKLDPASRSMVATQREEGRYRMKDPVHSDENRDDDLDQSVVHPGEVPVSWSRIPGQACRVPNRKLSTLSAGCACYRLRFSASGRDLAASCRDEFGEFVVVIFDVTSMEAKHECRGHAAIIYDVVWTSKDKALATASGDGTVRLWSLKDAGKAPDLQSMKVFPHPSFVYSTRIHPIVDAVLVSASFDGIVRVWRRGAAPEPIGQLVQELEGHRKAVNALCFNVDGTKLYSCDAEGVVIVWNVHVSKAYNDKRRDDDVFTTGEWTINSRFQPCSRGISSAEFLPGKDWIVLRSRGVDDDAQILVFDARAGAVVRSLNRAKNLRSHLHASCSPCGALILSGSEDGKAFAWNAETGKLLAVYDEGDSHGVIHDVQYHPHDHMVAISAGKDASSISIFKYDPTRPIPDAALTLFPAAAAAVKDTIDAASVVAGTALPRTTTPRVTVDTIAATPRSPNTTTLASLKEKLDAIALMPEASSSAGGRDSPSLSPLLSPPPPQRLSSPSVASSAAATPSMKLTMTREGDVPSPYFRFDNAALKGIGSPSGDDAAASQPEEEEEVVAIKPYRAERSDEINLHLGDVIKVLHKDNDVWWMGESTTNRNGVERVVVQGYFPRTHVTYVTKQSRQSEKSTSAPSTTTTSFRRRMENVKKKLQYEEGVENDGRSSLKTPDAILKSGQRQRVKQQRQQPRANDAAGRKKKTGKDQKESAETSIDELMKMMDNLDKDVEEVIEAVSPRSGGGGDDDNNVKVDGKKTSAIVVNDELKFVSTPASDDEDSVGSGTPLTATIAGGTMTQARRKRRKLKDLQAALEKI